MHDYLTVIPMTDPQERLPQSVGKRMRNGALEIGQKPIRSADRSYGGLKDSLEGLAREAIGDPLHPGGA